MSHSHLKWSSPVSYLCRSVPSGRTVTSVAQESGIFTWVAQCLTSTPFESFHMERTLSRLPVLLTTLTLAITKLCLLKTCFCAYANRPNRCRRNCNVHDLNEVEDCLFCVLPNCQTKPLQPEFNRTKLTVKLCRLGSLSSRLKMPVSSGYVAQVKNLILDFYMNYFIQPPNA